MTNGQVSQKLSGWSFKQLVNGMLAVAVACLLIGAPGSYAAPSAKEEAGKHQQVASTGKVNINKANAEAIADTLVGVGLKKAEAIVAYRTSHGGFKSVEQLQEVKGIGESTVAKNRSRILL